MASSLPTLRLPFTSFPGLPPEDGRRIWRDFEELVRNITPSASLFDAIIDSELASSNSATHQYKNLTDLVASENWTGHFNVGVRQGPTAITEPAGPSLVGKGSLSLFGLSAIQTTSGSDTHVTPWQWKTISPAAGQTVFLEGLLINPTGAQQIGASGYIVAVNCDFGTNVSGFNASGIAGQGGTCFDCTFRAPIAVTGSIGTAVTNTFYDCVLGGLVTVATKGIAIIEGGQCAGFSTSSANGSRVISDLSGNPLTVSAGGGVFINTGTSQTGGSVTVSDTAASVMVGGWWDGVSFTGTPASGLIRRFEGHCGHSVDFTGPGQVICTLGNAGGLGRLQLKGNDINAEVTVLSPLSSGVSALLNAVGLTNSLVKMSVADLAAGPYKAYAFDAASNHNILIIAGSLATNFSTASTDAGSHNRVITEDGDTLLSGSASAFGNNMLNQEIAAIQTGVQTFPPLGGAPSGAAGGSLAGTYPNPTFAGRDASVDKLNQDMTQTFLFLPG